MTKNTERKKLTATIKDILEKDYDRIDDRVNDLYKLFLKTKYPESFCPECDSQMFTVEGHYECMNCGYVAEQKIVEEPKSSAPIKAREPRKPADLKNVPDDVKRAIEGAENTKDRTVTSSDKAEKIRKLRAQMDGGGAGPVNEVDKAVVSSDPNVSSDTNWV